MILNFPIHDLDSKGLYFKLGNAFQLSDEIYHSKQYKFAGLYAIYKNDICLYVGQSQNLCSRISTHLTGRYSSADRVDFFMAVSNDFDDFYDRNKISRKNILETNELKLINELKPTENIIVDRELDCDDRQLFSCIRAKYDEDEGEIGVIHPDISVYLDRFNVTVADGYLDPTWISGISKNILKSDIETTISYLSYLAKGE